jgi:hypothetical protein
MNRGSTLTPLKISFFSDTMDISRMGVIWSNHFPVVRNHFCSWDQFSVHSLLRNECHCWQSEDITAPKLIKSSRAIRNVSRFKNSNVSGTISVPIIRPQMFPETSLILINWRLLGQEDFIRHCWLLYSSLTPVHLICTALNTGRLVN